MKIITLHKIRKYSEYFYGLAKLGFKLYGIYNIEGKLTGFSTHDRQITDNKYIKLFVIRL